MRVIVEFRKIQNKQGTTDCETTSPAKNIVKVEQKGLQAVAEKICQSNDCRYPLLALRLLIHVITSADASGRIYISARQLSKSLGVHYDTVTKCLKYLREIDVLRLGK